MKPKAKSKIVVNGKIKQLPQHLLKKKNKFQTKKKKQQKTKHVKVRQQLYNEVNKAHKHSNFEKQIKIKIN